MHRIVRALLIALTGVAAHAVTQQLPVQPKEGLLVIVDMSSAALAQEEEWRQQQSTRLGPPAPHLWMIWRLQQLPEGIGGPLVSGCEKLVHDQPAPVIPIPGIGSGLWRMTATVQTDTVDDRQIILTAWRCVEIKTGVAQTTTRLRLQPTLPLVVRLTLDQAPDPTAPALVGLCLFDDRGLVDLQFIEMKQPSCSVVFRNAPEGRLRIQAVVMSDVPPIRRAQHVEVVGKEHNLIILPLTRPPGDPKSQPTIPSVRGWPAAFFLIH